VQNEEAVTMDDRSDVVLSSLIVAVAACRRFGTSRNFHAERGRNVMTSSFFFSIHVDL